MKWEEYEKITGALDKAIKQEYQYSENYSQLNPTDRKQREHDRDMIVSGLLKAMHEINFLYTNGKIKVEK